MGYVVGNDTIEMFGGKAFTRCASCQRPFPVDCDHFPTVNGQPCAISLKTAKKSITTSP